MKNKSKARGSCGYSHTNDSDDELGDYEDVLSDDNRSDGSLIRFDDESDTSSEEEVLPVYSDSEDSNCDYEEDDDNNISESDINDGDGDDLPDPKAWGRNKKLYYNADNINDKINLVNEKEEEATKLEEEEARAIQQRLIAKIDDADIAFDLLTDVMFENKLADEKISSDQDEKIEIDLSQINEQEKIELLKKELPDFLTYIEDYKDLMICVRNELLPVIKILKDNNLHQSGASQFIKLYNQLIMNYCTNIIFYIMLRLRRVNTKFHPCNEWLSRYQNFVNTTKPTYENVYKPQIKLIIDGDFKPLSQSSRKRRLNVKNSTVKKQKNSSGNEMLQKVQPSDYFEEDPLSVKKDDLDGDNETESKRPITYQIAKNKGLTPHRKKELKNPRVKHRMKYRKAKIRRKGQVREVRKEIRKYDGELSGIKANVVKSVKFKT